jgi:hypothetical protein
VELPKLEAPLSSFLSGFSTKIRSYIIKSELGNEQAIYLAIKKMLNTQGMQTRMPYEIDIY